VNPPTGELGSCPAAPRALCSEAMAGLKTTIERNLARIRSDITAACERRGRSPKDVSVIAVTKSVDVDAIKLLVDMGVRDIGESRVPQLVERRRQIEQWLGGEKSRVGLRWHLIGHLQRNKVKLALEAADVIHSIDSLRLAEEINQCCGKAGRTVDVLMQVNCSNEPQKFGVAVGAAVHLAELVSTFAALRLVGLMTMAPLVKDAQDARPSFVRLKELFDEMRSEKISAGRLAHLSMGMSGDYTVAVEEGATMVRIGSSLFEEAV
jgi:pyridoxal phosphate enzyme (YggS family)